MPEQQPSSRKLAVLVRPTTGGSYSTHVRASLRPDGRWEGSLRFVSETDGSAIDTRPQTTQRSPEDVFAWATHLSVAHIENEFTAAVATRPDASPVPGAAPTPPGRDAQQMHLQAIESDVLSLFASRGTRRIPAQEIFDRGPHANADFVRAFQNLEKRWRYIVRRTIGGIDLLDLTTDGAKALGMSSTAGETTPAELPKPRA